MSSDLTTKTDDESTTTNEIDTFDSEEAVSGTGSEAIDLKEIEMADESAPLAQHTGSTGPHKREVDEEWLANFLAEEIYNENSVTVREMLQNAESACIEACKLKLRDHPEYGEEWLTRDLWIDAETGETVADGDTPVGDLPASSGSSTSDQYRRVSLPRSLGEYVEAARSIGYDPTIEVSLYRDERQVHFRDNGIGMTAKVVDEAYNYTGKSLSKMSSETGGAFGAGELTFGNFTGADGGMDMTTRTRKPGAPKVDRRGIKTYTYLGGVNEYPQSEIPDDFTPGTLKEIPLRPVEDGGPELDKFEDWVEEYADSLRVPVLYREFRSGETVVKEEYGGWSLVERFTEMMGEEPPIVVDRPGEFTLVAAPDLPIGSQGYNKPTYPDTWLVSMPIDRNTGANVKSFWNAAIQWHNEQGICIHGPHRGILKENVEEIHEDDIFSPTPTGTRDQLNNDDDNTAAHEYVAEQVKSAEFEEVSDVVAAMLDAEHPADAILEDESNWRLFRRMVSYHEHKAKVRIHTFKDFVERRNEFPDCHLRPNGTDGPKTAEEEAIEKIHELFSEVEHAPEDVTYPAKKANRKEDHIGDILADVPTENVYMAASTGGNFIDQQHVVSNTHDKWDVVVVSSASSYDRYESNFGFGYLKHVPLTQDDDHDFDVPDSVHGKHVSKGSTTSGGKPDTIDERTLKIRDNRRTQRINKRWTIETIVENLEKNGNIAGSPLVLFPNGKNYENISDHYDLQSYAAIASCTKEEYRTIEGKAPDGTVQTYEEFRDRSLSTVIATERGGRQVRNLLHDGEFIILVNASRPEHKLLLTDEKSDLREMYADYVVDKQRRYFDDDESDPEPVVAVADPKTVRRAEYGLDHITNTTNYDGEVRAAICGMYFGHSHFNISTAFRTTRITGNCRDDFERKASTPEWHDKSSVYYEHGKRDIYDEFLMGCHDAGLDPTVLAEGEVRRLVGKLDQFDERYVGHEDRDDGDGDDESSGPDGGAGRDLGGLFG